MYIKNYMKRAIITLFISISFVSNAFAQDIVISPSPLYLGKIPIGSTSEREVIIFNTTINQVTVNSLSVAGSSASKFTIVNNPGNFTLGAIEKKAFIIRYQPSAAEMNTAMLSVESSAGSFSDSLKGYGIPSFGGVQAFERILGTSEPDNGKDIKHTADGGFIIVGSTIPPDENYNYVYLMKTDLNGKVEWSTFYGDNDGPDRGSDVEQTADGGYLVLGTTDNWGAGGTDMMLLKFNSSGEFQWRKTFGSPDNDAGSAMVSTLDGGYALVGQTVPSSGIGKTIYLVKVNSSGDEQWSNTYGGSSGTDASDIVQLADGSFLMAGYITIGSDFQVYIVKTNSSGNLIWEKNYGGADLDHGYSISELSDGNLIVCGYTASKGAGARDGYLLKLDSDGNLIWDKTYGSSRSDEFRAAIETSDGSILAVGNSVTRVTQDEQYTDAYMVKTTSDGSEVWSHLFGENLSESFASIRQTNDGGYITIGSSSSYSKSSDIYLVKTGESGLVSDVNEEENQILVNDFRLYQNYPNPFNPTTKIKFRIPDGNSSFVRLKIYDVLGNEIKTLLDSKMSPGIHEVTFNAADLSNGVYFYQIVTSTGALTKKMILIK